MNESALIQRADALLKMSQGGSNSTDWIALGAELYQGILMMTLEKGIVSGWRAAAPRDRPRALPRPQFLILDEATSSMDAASVARIRCLAHERRGRGRAVIVIAHELDMVVDADFIVVLRDGTVVQQGTHADLVSRSGAYRSMWESLRVERVA